ncbi:hypothetical protein GQ44DRAFT_716735 [Phaeosphaeriaceae sp. PMI808]|nr:hypothetical protein GQ44DRAFT_716735 [Phaeosphaeriaceae sp. PMI808]
MSETSHVSTFFNLPLELREHIYKSVLSSSTYGFGILQTCRKISNEALKFLYQRPLEFQSQDVFYSWLEQAPSNLLSNISEISLKIQEVDLKSILNSAIHPFSELRLRTPQLYEAELERLVQALKRVPKVKTMTFQALSSQQSFQYRDFMTGLPQTISSTQPNLLDLRLEGNFQYQELEFLSSLKRLESFSFNGLSSSSPAATAELLSALQHFKHLSLIPQRSMLAVCIKFLGDFKMKRHTSPQSVVRTIDQPVRFPSPVPASSPTSIFSSRILASLYSLRDLECLSIHLAQAPDTETLDSLKELLESLSVQELELDWPDLDPFVLDKYQLLGGSLKTLWVRASSELYALGVLSFVAKGQETGYISRLRKVVLVRSTETYAKLDMQNHGNKDDELKQYRLISCSVSLLFERFVTLLCCLAPPLVS